MVEPALTGRPNSFFSSLDLDKADYRGQLIAVLEENAANGNFVLNHFMTRSILTNEGVVLINAFHSREHYHSENVRYGWSLKECVSSEQCLITDFSEPTNSYEDKPDPKKIFAFLKEKVDLMKSHKTQVSLVIDNLSSLVYLGASPDDVVSVVHYLRTIEDITLIICVHSSDSDEELSFLKRYFLRVADISMIVTPLATGRSKDVSGCLKVVRRYRTTVRLPNIYNRHYKASSKGVKVFPVGTAGR